MRVIAFGILALIVSLAAIHESSSESATIMAEQAATPRIDCAAGSRGEEEAEDPRGLPACADQPAEAPETVEAAVTGGFMRGPTTITKGGGSATTPSAEVEEWKQALVTRIDANKRYPPEALRRGEGGVTQVYFEIDREGRVTSSRIIRSSGSAILDQEALDLLQRVSPLPAPPAALPGPTARLTLPVRFNYASPLTIEGSAPTPPAEVTDWMAVAEWKKVAVASIRRNTRYPPGARGEGGTARVYFEIDQDGKVTSSRIVSSSGSVFFDREALDMLRRASPLPAPPASLGPTVKLTLPIRFNAAAAPRSSEPAEGKGKR